MIYAKCKMPQQHNDGGRSGFDLDDDGGRTDSEVGSGRSTYRAKRTVDEVTPILGKLILQKTTRARQSARGVEAYEPVHFLLLRGSGLLSARQRVGRWAHGRCCWSRFYERRARMLPAPLRVVSRVVCEATKEGEAPRRLRTLLGR